MTGSLLKDWNECHSQVGPWALTIRIVRITLLLTTDTLVDSPWETRGTIITGVRANSAVIKLNKTWDLWPPHLLITRAKECSISPIRIHWNSENVNYSDTYDCLANLYSIGNHTVKRVVYFLNHINQQVGRWVLINHHKWREWNDRNEWWLIRTH